MQFRLCCNLSVAAVDTNDTVVQHGIFVVTFWIAAAMQLWSPDDGCRSTLSAVVCERLSVANEQHAGLKTLKNAHTQTEMDLKTLIARGSDASVSIEQMLQNLHYMKQVTHISYEETDHLHQLSEKLKAAEKGAAAWHDLYDFLNSEGRDVSMTAIRKFQCFRMHCKPCILSVPEQKAEQGDDLNKATLAGTSA
eukprot:jgi/Chrzof1/6355/Cz18g05140.t1